MVNLENIINLVQEVVQLRLRLTEAEARLEEALHQSSTSTAIITAMPAVRQSTREQIIALLSVSPKNTLSRTEIIEALPSLSKLTVQGNLQGMVTAGELKRIKRGHYKLP